MQSQSATNSKNTPPKYTASTNYQTTNTDFTVKFESKEDPQLLSEMDWNLVFNGVRIKKRKYGLVIHGVPKKDLDPNTENEIILGTKLKKKTSAETCRWYR